MTASAPLHEIAASVCDDLAERDDVRAVLLVGSTAMGYADDHSDVDLQVVGSADAGERTVDAVHVEWTPITPEEIEADLSDWEDDAALYTYANADVLYDRVEIAELLADYDAYPPSILREKLYAGWFYGTGDAFDARKADRRGDERAKRCAVVSAVEQFTALTYLLDGRFPPYRKWLFRELPDELPGIDAALSGDLEALETMVDDVEAELRDRLDDERLEKPYLFQPEFGPLG